MKGSPNKHNPQHITSITNSLCLFNIKGYSSIKHVPINSTWPNYKESNWEIYLFITFLNDQYKIAVFHRCIELFWKFL